MRELGPKRFVEPVVDTERVLASPRGYRRFFADLKRYRALDPGATLSLAESYPQIHDRTASSGIDSHYFHQGVWAARRVARLAPEEHVDVGSQLDYVGFLTAITNVTFLDIRPLDVDIAGLTTAAGNILDLPYADGSVRSLSCLHVAEHVGLGRYGDQLDPAGTVKAARELQRVLAPGGQLLFSVPVGKPRTCFNAHRIHRPDQVVAMFGELRLDEFSGIDDVGEFREDRELDALSDANYGCGLFKFTRTGG